MTEDTIRRLNALNQQFYTHNALSFSNTRTYTWPSWQKFWEQSAFKESSEATILDLGCGNGRLAAFIAKQLPRNSHWTYEGWDSSPALRQSGESVSPARLATHFQDQDVVEILLQNRPWPTTQRYTVVALFGVMHHIPSLLLRQQLLQRVHRELLVPGGEIWLTLWDPQRYKLKTPALQSDPSFAPAELEAGDLFLGWQASEVFRYVHFISPEEEKQLLQPLQCSKVVAWDTVERGERGNRCLLLTS